VFWCFGVLGFWGLGGSAPGFSNIIRRGVSKTPKPKNTKTLQTLAMAFLFWLFWTLDLGIGLLTFFGKGFRRSFTASDPTAWVSVFLAICIIAAPVIRFIFRRTLLGLIVAALPLLVMLVWYLIDKTDGSNV
jgi:hypothetical protein